MTSSVGLGALQSYKNSKNPKIIWIELNPPTHPPLSKYVFFLETHQWHGQNTQITTFNNVQTEYHITLIPHEYPFPTLEII